MALDVSELITEVRNQLDEDNTDNVTNAQILAALNRGQRKGTNIIARQYDDLFISVDTSITTVAGQRDYAIPAAAFGRRIEKVEVEEGNGIAYEVRRIDLHDTTQFNTTSQVSRPYYYALAKNQFKLYPTPSGGQTLRVWYLDKPEKLVLPQGRVTSVNIASNYVLVDDVGSAVTTDATSGFGAYVNFVDYNTGDIKGSAQIAALDEDLNQITFKSAGLTRSTVLGKTIGTTIPTTLEPDDYVCVVSGTCVPEIPGAYTDYLMQYAVLDIRRRLGEPTDAEYAQLKEMETELQKMWVGRESSHRVRKTGSHWGNTVGSRLRRKYGIG